MNHTTARGVPLPPLLAGGSGSKLQINPSSPKGHQSPGRGTNSARPAASEIEPYVSSPSGTSRRDRVKPCRSRIAVRGDLAALAGYKATNLARLWHVSLRELERGFKRHFQRTPHDWLNRARLRAAQRLLLSEVQPKRVAVELGFRHAPGFCRWFKLHTGRTPGAFVRRHVSQKGNNWSQNDNHG